MNNNLAVNNSLSTNESYLQKNGFVKIFDLEFGKEKQDKKLFGYCALLHSYIFFHKSEYTYTIKFTIKDILKEFNLYAKNIDTRGRYVKEIKDVLEVFLERGFYEICKGSDTSYENIKKCTEESNIKLYFNESQYNKYANKFIKITFNEYFKITDYLSVDNLSIKINGLNLFEILLALKKLMFKRANADYCFYTKQHLVDSVSFGKDTLNNNIDYLLQTKAIWVYPIEEYKKRFNIKDKYTYIASLHRLGIEEIECAVEVLG